MKTRNKVVGLGLALGAGVGVFAAARHHLRLRRDYGPERALDDGLPNGTADVPLALLQATGNEFVGGNAIELLNDAAVFDALERALATAQRSIHVDLYIWKPGAPGTQLARLAARRAREGLAVRLLVDPIGSEGFDEQLAPALRAAGCEVQYFRPPKKRPLTFTGRNHRKLVVIDGQTAFTGGFGIAPEWNDVGPHAGGWRDVNLRVHGPVVRQLQLSFAAHWLESGGRLIEARELERVGPKGDAEACFVTSMGVKGLSAARWVTQIALVAAKRRAWIANAYFVPPPALIRTICDQSSKGVDVQLLLPGPHQDHPSVTFIQRRLYGRLGDCGVQVFEYQPSMMHAKTMLIDDDLVVVGSINLDFLSQELLDEGALVVRDERLAAELEASFEADKARSKHAVAPTPARLLSP